MASEKAVHKARVAAAFQAGRAEQKLFRVLEVTPTVVVFFYGGYHVRFEWRGGDLVRIGGENAYLQPDDYAFLFLQAEMLTKANILGLNNAKAATAKKKLPASLPQPSLPFLFTGQGSLR